MIYELGIFGNILKYYLDRKRYLWSRCSYQEIIFLHRCNRLIIRELDEGSDLFVTSLWSQWIYTYYCLSKYSEERRRNKNYVTTILILKNWPMVSRIGTSSSQVSNNAEYLGGMMYNDGLFIRSSMPNREKEWDVSVVIGCGIWPDVADHREPTTKMRTNAGIKIQTLTRWAENKINISKAVIRPAQTTRSIGLSLYNIQNRIMRTNRLSNFWQRHIGACYQWFNVPKWRKRVAEISVGTTMKTTARYAQRGIVDVCFWGSRTMFRTVYNIPVVDLNVILWS